MDFGFFNKFVDGPINWSLKQWLATVAVVEGNWAIGSSHNIFKGSVLKIAAEFSKAPVIIRDLVGELT